jgi:hypothetical protein
MKDPCKAARIPGIAGRAKREKPTESLAKTMKHVIMSTNLYVDQPVAARWPLIPPFGE